MCVTTYIHSYETCIVFLHSFFKDEVSVEITDSEENNLEENNSEENNSEENKIKVTG